MPDSIPTIQLRLALEAEADRLDDLEQAAYEKWRQLASERAALEETLRNLPGAVRAPETKAAA